MNKQTENPSDGGPAFPRPAAIGSLSQDGMTLRDYFAGQALAGWLASFGENASHPATRGNEPIVAEEAYKMADAMLKARDART